MSHLGWLGRLYSEGPQKWEYETPSHTDESWWDSISPQKAELALMGSREGEGLGLPIKIT